VPNGGLGLRDFCSYGQALRLAIFKKQSKSFFLLKYFFRAQLASIWHDWAQLCDNATPNALSPSIFYSPLLVVLCDLNFQKNFILCFLPKFIPFLFYPCNGPLLFLGSFR